MLNNKFISIIRPYKWKLLIVVLANFVSLLFSIFTLLLIEPLVKLFFQGNVSDLSHIGAKLVQLLSVFIDLSHPKQSVVGIVVVIAVLFLLKNFFILLTQWLLAPIRSDVICTLRNRMYRKVLHLPLSFFSAQRKGDVISRSVNDTQEIEFTTLNAFQMFVTSLLTVLIYVAALFTVSVRLTLFVLVLLPVAGFVISRISRSLRKKNREMKEELGVLTSHVEETISGLRIVKGFNAQKHAEGVFDRHNEDVSSLQRKICRRGDLASPMSEFLGVTAVMIVLVFGGALVLSGDSTLTAPLFITYIALFAMVVNPAKDLGTALSNYNRGIAALDRIFEVLDAEENITDPAVPEPLPSFENEIRMEDVSFSYGNADVLRHIDLTVRKGEVVALVGASGAGKSTLVDLLPRFYDVTGGRILVDGVDIRKCRLEQLRSLFSIVTQEVILFNDTIYNNVAFGMEHVTEEAVWEALRTANALDFVEALPEKLYTNVSDRGLNLSGGQRQRLSIARAVLRNTPLLILDEATSAMDTESEKLVQSALDRVMQNRTTIVIAHRLSTIRNADKIVVLDAGEIVEMGTHEELMRQNGKYAELSKLATTGKGRGNDPNGS